MRDPGAPPTIVLPRLNLFLTKVMFVLWHLGQ
jgi:hypothetical protein